MKGLSHSGKEGTGVLHFTSLQCNQALNKNIYHHLIVKRMKPNKYTDVINDLSREVKRYAESMRWYHREIKKEFPYKVWPRTKKAAAKRRKEFARDIIDLKKRSAIYKDAIKLLKRQP